MRICGRWSILPVKGTVMDFTGLHPIGEQIDKTDEQLRLAEGYDHNFILQKEERGSLSKAAEVVEPESGRTMTVFTDQPGIQFYSGNLMKPCTGKGGREYGKRDGFLSGSTVLSQFHGSDALSNAGAAGQ